MFVFCVLCVHIVSQERARLINHIATQPERQWTSSCWSFKNEGKVYGSPMFDALWFEVLQVGRIEDIRETGGGIAASQSLRQATYCDRP